MLVLIDEIHVQRSRELYDALTYASAARKNSLMLSVSTVGVADTTTIWWEQYAYAKGVLSGEIHDEARFAYVAQADEGCKDSAEMRADPKQWAKAMPSLGITVTEEKVRESVREAENSPAKLNNLLRYMFNIPTAQVDRVIPMEQWDACQWDVKKQGPFPDLKGRLCFGGLDIASSEDLTTFVKYFPPQDDDSRGFLVSNFWCPESKVQEREHKQLAHYGQWVREGHLEETPGERIDHNIIIEKIYQDYRDYQIAEVAFDRWNADKIVNELENNGVDMVQIEQTFVGMSPLVHGFLNTIAEKRIWHDGNPVMTWCCSNTAADTREDQIRFAKGKSADKIDGAVGAAMAIGRGVLDFDAVTFYDSNELEMF